MVHQDDRALHFVELGLPAGFIVLDSPAKIRVSLEKLGAGDFQPRVGVYLALGPVVILEERRVTVVKGQEPLGHFRFAGEPNGRMREPERLLAQADRTSLAGHLVKSARAYPEQHQEDRADSHQTRGNAGGHRPVTLPHPSALPEGRGPLSEIPRCHRADHCGELVAVPRCL